MSARFGRWWLTRGCTRAVSKRSHVDTCRELTRLVPLILGVPYNLPVLSTVKGIADEVLLLLCVSTRVVG